MQNKQPITGEAVAGRLVDQIMKDVAHKKRARRSGKQQRNVDDTSVANRFVVKLPSD